MFIDVAGIQAGRDFRKAIDESVATCGVLLAVIGRNWLDAKNAAGKRRLDDPSDFVRLETAAALKRDIPVIPVLVHGATMPVADQLPDDLRDLSYRNGCELTHALRPYVEDPPAAPKPGPFIVPPTPQPVPAPLPSPRKFWPRILIMAATAVFAVAVLFTYISRRPANTTPVNPVVTPEPTAIQVPALLGMPLAIAKRRLAKDNLSVGTVTTETSTDAHRNTVLREFFPPCRKVDPGISVELVVSGLETTPPTGRTVANFAGTWQLFESTTNNTSQPVVNSKLTTTTQNGSVATIGSRSYNITAAGTITDQSFAAHDAKFGHFVATAQEADLIDTFTWSISGQTLVFETVFTYRNQYCGHPPVTEARVMKYRRVEPGVKAQ